MSAPLHPAPSSPLPGAGGHAELSAAYVRKVAVLSRLALSDEEIEDCRVKLSAVVALMERLRSVDLAGVEPLMHVGVSHGTSPSAESENRLDDDVPGPVLDANVLMTMAPESWESYVRVPIVMGDGGGA